MLAVMLAFGACGTAGVAAGSAGSGREASSLEEGRAVFLEVSDPGCPVCHALADANAGGTLGPDLDELRPDASRVIRAVTQGVGIMGAQEHLTERQVQALATYVAGVAGERSP